MRNRKMQEREFNRELGERMRNARLAANMTQGELAIAVGLSRGSIANMERGQQAPSPFRLATIAQQLRLPLHQLVPDVDELVETASAPVVSPGRQDTVERLWKAAERRGVRRSVNG